ncbi:hypothetical protein ASG48_02220 [Aurantimonas sp. Leaf443]|nr:hypothetical protein ASG48_02220 [Aurantimonas sp. Leaf443]
MGPSVALAAFSVTAAMAAEPIVGQWRAPGGGIVEISACGDSYCATVASERHKGKAAGRTSGTGESYGGTVTGLRDERTHQGRAVIEGSTLKLAGCALKIFCKSQVRTRV